VKRRFAGNIAALALFCSQGWPEATSRRHANAEMTRRAKMKRIALGVALLAAFPAVADLDTQLRTPLIGFEEVPSVSTRANGELLLRVNGDGNFIDYQLRYSGLQGQVRQAHIHFAQTAVNGPIVIWLCQTAATPGPAGTQTCPQSGTITGTISAANVLGAPGAQQLPPGDLSRIIAAIRGGAAYANVHTDLSPGGEIRGQVGGPRSVFE
jgi:hypothetical protein